MAGQRPMTIVGFKSLLKQQYLQCTHPVVTLVNKGIQELSIVTQNYILLILLEVCMTENKRRQLEHTLTTDLI
jgi:hypothetical protein